MKEITQETKAKIYALYYGQKILKHTDSPGHEYTVGESIHIWDCTTRGYYLHLKILSNITDEDAIELAKGKLGDNNNPEDLIKHAKSIISFSDFCGGLGSREADFLRTKGYATDCFEFTVEQLVDSGIFKLKTPTNKE